LHGDFTSSVIAPDMSPANQSCFLLGFPWPLGLACKTHGPFWLLAFANASGMYD